MTRRPLLSALSILLFTGPASASGIDSLVATLPRAMVSGYGRSIGGETINYHSAVDRARSALLVRANDGTASIEWETAPAPAHPVDGRVVFPWLAAISGSKGVHRFDLFVDGKKTCAFMTSPDSIQKSWTVRGEGGATLSFCATEADRFQDLFGYMFLLLPARRVPAGKPLRIRVQGEAAGSSAWYMTFEHALADEARARPLPALLRGKGKLMQPVSVTVEHYGRRATGDIGLEGTPAQRVSMGWGETTLEVPVPQATAAESRRIRVTLGARLLCDTVVALRPVRQRTITLLPHSHTDIGYSAPQPEVEKSHIRYIDQAIALAEKSASYPEGAGFRWNIEVLWPLDTYLASATEEQKARLVSAVRKGWIGINGLYSNVLTGLCTPEELFHLTDFARRSAAMTGVPVTTAMITDIPSYSSSIVTALARAGIRYFSSGPNYVATLPDGGDRIGMSMKTWGDRPFFWVSRSRQDTVLFWMAGRGYSWFHGLNMGELSTARPSAIFDYCDELDAKQYPYEIVQVRYTIGGDNGPPDPHLSDAVIQWNSRYASPRFAISTTRRLFEEFASRYGKNLPTFTGDLTPHWEDGAASTASEVAMNRKTAEGLTQTAFLYALSHAPSIPSDEFTRAWRGVHLFDEHTWGAWNSISDPDSPAVLAQWEYKRNFAVSADRRGKALRDQVIPPKYAQPVRALDIVNTGSWVRTDLVILPDTLRLAGLRVRDFHGAPVPAQRLASGEAALLVRDATPLGVTRLLFEPGDPFLPDRAARIDGLTLTDGTLRLVVDPRTGAIRSLVAGPGQEDFVDTSRGGLNQYWYVPGRDPKTALTDSAVTVIVTDRGPLVASVTIVSKPPGSAQCSRIIRLTGGLGRVDLIDAIDKLRVRQKESVHIGFPFRIPTGTVRIDNGWEFITPGRDQLPGSNNDYFPVHRWVDASNGSNGVTLLSPDAPLLEAGAMTDETLNRAGTRSWREGVPGTTILYSYLMNNYWHTNYKADQEGRAVFRYSIRPHAGFDAGKSTREGMEAAQPLLVTPAQDRWMPGESLFTLQAESAIVQLCKPSDQGRGWIVHLYNPGSRGDSIAIRWGGHETVRWFSSDLSEHRDNAIQFPLVIPPGGIAIVKGEAE